MNVQQKLIRTILQFTPTEKSDPLINSNVHLGKPINRVDGKLKVTGKALYSAEYPLKDYRMRPWFTARLQKAESPK